MTEKLKQKMTNYHIKTLLNEGLSAVHKDVIVKGWVRSFRSKRFIALNDGSTLKNLQIVVDFEQMDEEILKQISTGASVKVAGTVAESQGKGQEIEIVAQKITIYGGVNPDELQETILQPKRHSLEKLREQAHLRFRTQTFSSIMRVRHHLMIAVHNYFHQNGFFYINTPIITGSDAEGAGEMFAVTNLPINSAPTTESGEVDFSQDFFGKKTNLTVSGQLEAEAAAMGLGKVYTFGPTFRAENSNTSRHLAEFWMVEPEIAFTDLAGCADLAEAMLKYICQDLLDNHAEDMQFFDKFVEKGTLERVQTLASTGFERVTYTEAVDILLKSNQSFEFPVEWGIDLQSEHERYLVEQHFKKPAVVTDYPKNIKSFYMRLNDDGKTVAAMDVLAPGIGEIIGGSQREERLEVLEARMIESGLTPSDYDWYLDLRRYGSTPHAGFGLGLERLVSYVTGVSNVRDVIAFPRTPGSAPY